MPTESAPPAEWMLEAAKELGRQRRHITGYQPVKEVARVIAKFAPAPEEREPDSSSVMQDDMAELLRVLGLGDHARPCSPHEVMVSEIIPAVRQLVRLPKAPAPANSTVDHPWKSCAESVPLTDDIGCLRPTACHDVSAGECKEPEGAHPSAVPEPPAPIPAPEPAAQDRLGEIAQHLERTLAAAFFADGTTEGRYVSPETTEPLIRAELERVVRDCAEAADVSADRESFDAVLAHWGLK